MMTTWILDSTMMERMRLRGCGGMDMEEAARGLDHHVIKGKIENSILMLEAEIPQGRVIVHGSILFAKLLSQYATPEWICHNALMHGEDFSVSSQQDFLGAHALNHDITLTTWGEAKTKSDFPFFIRPNSAWKFFAGTLVKDATSPAWLEILDKTLDDDLSVIVSSPKEILGEARHLILDGKVVAQSLYRWNNRLDIRIDTHPLQDALANLIAQMPNQPSRAYVCDTALIEDKDGLGVRVVELNPFTSAGLYGMKTLDIVKAFSRAS